MLLRFLFCLLLILFPFVSFTSILFRFFLWDKNNVTVQLDFAPLFYFDFQICNSYLRYKTGSNLFMDELVNYGRDS
jgi:hypothetical protein